MVKAPWLRTLNGGRKVREGSGRNFHHCVLGSTVCATVQYIPTVHKYSSTKARHQCVTVETGFPLNRLQQWNLHLSIRCDLPDDNRPIDILSI